jgi:hypothetical protein
LPAKTRIAAGTRSCIRIRSLAMHPILRRLLGLLLALPLLLVQGVAVAQEQVFAMDQLDQLVAPIALHPDPVVAQIMMASTYPLEVVSAHRWLEQNKGLQGEALDQQGAAQGWDPSVVSMLHFPDVLKMMNDNLDWTQDLGDAVLAQQKDVMDAVQRMRKRAQDEGNLQTTEQQKVVVENEVIVIQPATEVVYVPAYNPTVVYGTWAVPTPYYPWYSYPPSYWYPPAYPAGAGLVAFGVGMAWGAAIWGDCDWGRGDIDIDIDRNTNINRNTNVGDRSGKWQHDAAHRQGVRYKDDATRARYDQASRTARDQRVAHDQSRGYDRSGARDASPRDTSMGARDTAGRTDRGGTAGDRGTSTRDLGARDTGSRDMASRAGPSAGTRDRSSGSGSAFSDNRSATTTRAASDRGFSSRSGGGMSSGMRSGGGGMRGGGGRR